MSSMNLNLRLACLGAACTLLVTTRGAEVSFSATKPALDAGRYSSVGDHVASQANYLVGQVGGETYNGFAVFSTSALSLQGSSGSSTTTSYGRYAYYTGGTWMRRSDLDFNPLLPAGPRNQPGNNFGWQWVGNFEKRNGIATTSVYTYSDARDLQLTLRVASASYSTSVGDALHAYDVTTMASIVRGGGTGLASVFSDLGTGHMYGSANPVTTSFAIPLDGTAASDFLAKYALGDQFVVGLALPGADDGEYVFGGSANPAVIALGLFWIKDFDVSTSTTTLPDVSVNPSGNARVLDEVHGGILLYATQGYSVDETLAGKGYRGNIWWTSGPAAPDFIPYPVPEPATSALAFGLGLMGFALARRGRSASA